MQHRRFMALLIATAGLLALLPTATLAQQRVALVIGNASYAHAPLLANPLNDAADIGASLARLGFQVTKLENADYATLRQGLLAFTRAASAAEVAVVFYAGHGIEVDQRNFLVPVDARLTSDQDVEYEAVPLELVTRSVARASGLRLVILDACRENPFAVAMQRSGATRAIGRGLARVEPAGETLVAYASKEGTVAADGEGRNSPYSTALLAHLEEPGLEIGLMFRKVRDAVLASTGGRQEPFVYGSLSSRGVYLTARAGPDPKPSTVTPPAGDTLASDRLTAEQLAAQRLAAERELLFWESVKDSSNPADIQAYLDRYPGGTYEVLAGNRLEALQGSQEPSTALEAPQVTAESLEARLELSRSDRRLIQLGLRAEGFDLGAADGLIGNRTRAALRQWQDSQGQAPTGYLDVESAKALLAAGEQVAARQVAAEAERQRREEEARQRTQERARREAEEAERRQREREAQERGRREAEARQKWEGLGLVMVRVEGGSFTMGCKIGRDRDHDDTCHFHEVPSHRVQVPGFEISKYEVTQALWEAVMGHNPMWFRPCGAECPAAKVSWEDVQVFLRKLNGRTGKRYRLPTEAEWEYAARGGRQSLGYRYAGGNDVGSVAWYGDNSDDRAHPVGHKRVNELDLHDMSGNVSEWVEDCWNDSYRGAPADGQAWKRGDCSQRVVRGGSTRKVLGGPYIVRSAYRDSASTGDRWGYQRGFRIARTLKP